MSLQLSTIFGLVSNLPAPRGNSRTNPNNADEHFAHNILADPFNADRCDTTSEEYKYHKPATALP